MHFEAGQGIDINSFSADSKSRFVDSLKDSMAMLLSATDESASAFCIENLNYPFERVWPIVEESALSVTLDIGHLEYYGFPTALYLERYLSKAKVLHMHGSLNGKDHHSLSCMKRESLDLVINALSDQNMPDRVMTMEIFSHDDFLSSCIAMQSFLI